MEKEDHPNYEVGYGRPPRNTRFKKGESGRTRARVPKAQSLADLVQSELDAPVQVIDNGRRKTIRKGRAFVQQLVNKAVAGDCRNLQLLFRAQRGIEERPPRSVVTMAQQAVMRRRIERELERERQGQVSNVEVEDEVKHDN